MPLLSLLKIQKFGFTNGQKNLFLHIKKKVNFCKVIVIKLKMRKALDLTLIS